MQVPGQPTILQPRIGTMNQGGNIVLVLVLESMKTENGGRKVEDEDEDEDEHDVSHCGSWSQCASKVGGGSFP